MLKIIDGEKTHILDWVYFPSDSEFFAGDVKHRLLVFREGQIEIFGLGYNPNDEYTWDVLNFIAEHVGSCQQIDRWEVLDIKFDNLMGELLGKGNNS